MSHPVVRRIQTKADSINRDRLHIPKLALDLQCPREDDITLLNSSTVTQDVLDNGVVLCDRPAIMTSHRNVRTSA